MTVESASYISQLDDTLPLSGDKKREGDNHIRLVKDVLKTQFPNFGTAAMNATVAELNYSVGVTSAIQAQLDALTSAKAAKSGATYTGTHDFTGATIRAATLPAGTATTELATTAHVSAVAFSAALPGQTGNAGRYVTTDGVNASWQSVAGAISVISTDTTAVSGNTYVLTASLVLTLPASPVSGDWVAIQNSSGTATATILRNGKNIMSTADNLTVDVDSPGFRLVYTDATRGWLLV